MLNMLVPFKNRKGKIFFTDVYTYNIKTCFVYFERTHDQTVDVLGVKYCMLWFKYLCHFDRLEVKDDANEPVCEGGHEALV